jgi:hypothetical protein
LIRWKILDGAVDEVSEVVPPAIQIVVVPAGVTAEKPRGPLLGLIVMSH